MAFSDTKQPGDLITASDYNDLVDDLFTRIKGNNINKATADTSANLPVPGEGDKILIETDTGRTLYDNGSEFVEVGLSESQINLSNLGSRSHSDLTDITSDDHHTKTTDLDDLNDVKGITAFEENSSGNLPSPGTEGRIFFETDTGRTLYDDGSTFVEIGLSESEIKLGDVGNLDAGQKKITNLADPTDARDAVNKQFVDRSQAGLEVKESTRVATASTSIDLTSTGDPNPVDGVNLNDGDRVLLKDQTDATENGIYDAVNATDPTTWVRSNDFDEDSEVAAGAFVFVEEGSDNKNEGYVVKTNDPITLGSTAIEWTQFSGLGQVVAGDGIEKSGDILNVRMPLEDDATQVTTVSAIDFGGDDFLVTDDTDNTATVQLSNDSLSIAGNSVSLGGSTTVDYVDLNDTGASFPIPNADMANSSVSVAGNSVSLGGSTTVQYVDLNDTGASFPIPNADMANSSVSVAGNSVSLGGSTTVDYVDLNDTGASFPIPNTDLSNSSVSVAGNSVALGGSTAVNHSDLSNIGTGDHHTRYSDEEAQDAVGGILNTDFSYDDAGNNISLASNSLTVANTSIALGSTGTPEVDNFNGNNGNSGQFLQTDGTNLSFESITVEETASVSSNFTTSGQTTVFADVSGNTLTVTLATSDAEDGRKVRVVDKAGNAGNNNITVNTEGSQTINGETSAILNDNFEALTFQSDGTDWFIVGRMAGGSIV
jgi:hypothetical protein